MVRMVDFAEEALSKSELDEWGYMLDRAWNLKKQMANTISNTLIDGMYEKARNVGAYGGKVLGAGGGGFLLLYVPEEKQDVVRETLQEYREVEFHFENEGSRIIFME
jgi:D-glycero-alpha-D-manno-heptose-7-phosphate kinase